MSSVPWVASTRRRVPLCVKACTQPGALRYASPDVRVRGLTTYTCNERRVTTPPGAAIGTQQGAHTTSGLRRCLRAQRDGHNGAHLRRAQQWRSLLDRATSRTSSLSRCGRSTVLLVCPPCRWSLSGHRAASCCRRLQVALRGCRAHGSIGVGVRCARVDPHFNRLSARPAADAARSQYLRNNINKQERTRTMNKGTSTLLSTSNVLRTAVRPRAALPPFTVQSSMYHPTT